MNTLSFRTFYSRRTQEREFCSTLFIVLNLALPNVENGIWAMPVRTLYVNSVKLRLVMGVYTFVFGWRLSLFTKTKQFWSVPFVSEKKRKKYLKTVINDLKRDLGPIPKKQEKILSVEA